MRLPIKVPPKAHTADIIRRRAMADSASVDMRSYRLPRALCPRFGVLSLETKPSLLLLLPPSFFMSFLAFFDSTTAILSSGNKNVQSKKASLLFRRKL